MRTIHVIVDDRDYRSLVLSKGSMSWREFLLKQVKLKERKGHGKKEED